MSTPLIDWRALSHAELKETMNAGRAEVRSRKAELEALLQDEEAPKRGRGKGASDE